MPFLTEQMLRTVAQLRNRLKTPLAANSRLQRLPEVATLSAFGSIPVVAGGTLAYQALHQGHPTVNDAPNPAMTASPTPAQPPAPTAAPKAEPGLVDQATELAAPVVDKLKGYGQQAVDFAKGFGQNPGQWDTTHKIVGGVGGGLAATALLGHLLSRKKKPAPAEPKMAGVLDSLANGAKQIGSGIGQVGKRVGTGIAGTARAIGQTAKKNQLPLAGAGIAAGSSAATMAADHALGAPKPAPGLLDQAGDYFKSFAQSPTNWGAGQWGGVGAGALLAYLMANRD